MEESPLVSPAIKEYMNTHKVCLFKKINVLIL